MRTAFLDLTDKGKYLYLFEKKQGPYALVQESEFSLTGSPELAALLNDTDTTYLSLPLSMLNFRLLELPFSDIEKIRDIMPFHLEGLTMDRDVIGDVCLPTQAGDTSGPDKKQQALAVYVQKEVLGKLLKELKAVNIDPEIVTSIDLKAAVASGLSNSDIAGMLVSGSLVEKGKRPELAVEELKNNTINLRRGELVYTKKTEDIMKSLRITAALFLLLFFVLIADLTMKLVSTKKEISDIKTSISKAYSQMFPSDKKVTNELYQTKAKIKELTDRKEHVAGINPLAGLLKITRVSGQGAIFSEITMDRSNLVLKGEAPSLGDIQKVKAGLEGPFDNLEITDTKTVSPTRIVFTITAREKK